jgi:hypothetical protein
MNDVTFRFYADLNDFLPLAHRQANLVSELRTRASVKDLIESHGVPHPEVDLVFVNGRPVDFSYVVAPGDRVAVYPAFTAFEVPPEVRLLPPPPAEPRFVADAHLGRLAAYLRLLGLDTLYRNDYDDAELSAISAREDRTLLSRDVGLLKHAVVRRGYFLRQTEPGRQLAEVVARFGLAAHAQPFTRCLRCNTPLRPVDRSRVASMVPPRARERFEEYSLCVTCGRVYWKGTHYERMRRLVDAVLATAAPATRPVDLP